MTLIVAALHNRNSLALVNIRNSSEWPIVNCVHIDSGSDAEK